MHITLVPQRRDGTLTLRRAGDSLSVNGEVFDFSGLAEGERLPAETLGSDWIAGEVTRAAGRIRLALILPHGPEAGEETRFPVPLDDPPDGPVALPPRDAPVSRRAPGS